MEIYLKKVTLAILFFMAFLPFVQLQAQNSTKKYGEDSLECVKNISLYREDFRQNNYIKAYPAWKWVVANCPMSTKYIFTNGPVILDYLIANEKDSIKRNEYIQELFDLFELRIKCYPPDEGYVLGRIGVYLMKYRQYEYKKAFDCMEKSIELEGMESSPQVLDMYFQTAELYMSREKLTQEIMIDAYDKVTEVLDGMIDEGEVKMEKIMRAIYTLRENLDSGVITQEEYTATYENTVKDSAKAANELTQLRNVSNNLDIRFSKYASCDILIQIYTKKFETSKDIRTLRQIVKFFTKENCTDNDLFIAAVEEMYKQTPNANIAFYMGSIKYKKGNFNEALTYLNQAMDMFEKESDKIKTYLLMAECYKQLNQYSVARETAYKILKLNPNDGRVYIFVGDLYMSTAASCNTSVAGAAYWAAADKFSRAKAIDPERAEEAQKRLNTATTHFPKTESYFQQGLKAGESYRIDCWIGETTTIR
ncbi:MAG: tetratricopeptide repeat protein [Bacteroidales bacterium]|jgi:tetratricopeptide (TPR) repeat protein|nr:tetratricopeptide repeat protein [Bacteroidales bacterium]